MASINARRCKQTTLLTYRAPARQPHSAGKTDVNLSDSTYRGATIAEQTNVTDAHHQRSPQPQRRQAGATSLLSFSLPARCDKLGAAGGNRHLCAWRAGAETRREQCVTHQLLNARIDVRRCDASAYLYFRQRR